MKNKQSLSEKILYKYGKWGLVVFVGIMVYFQIPNEVKKGTIQIIKTNEIIQIIMGFFLLLIIIFTAISIFLWIQKVGDWLCKKFKEEKNVK